MPCKVELNEDVEEAISKWNMPRPLVIAMYKQLLLRLTTCRVEEIGEVHSVAPVRLRTCSIPIVDTDAGVMHNCSFWVNERKASDGSGHIRQIMGASHWISE